MRQYRFDFAESLKAGLVPANPTSLNNQGFVRLQNAYPWAGALVYRDPFVTAQVWDLASEIFSVGTLDFCADSANISLLDPTSGVFDPKMGAAHSGEQRWSCADFTKFGMFQDGTSIAYVLGDGTVTDLAPFDSVMPKARSVVDLHGQLILGGIVDGWNNLDDTYVAWSKIGSVDMTPDKTNEAGFRCPNLGSIVAVLKFGENFLAMGTTGIGVFYPADHTFGYRRVSSLGVKSAWHCCSSGEDAYFVDAKGILRKISATSNVERTPLKVDPLGYDWLFKNRDCKLHWNAGEDELRIVVDNQKTYILNQYGMYETDLVILGSLTRQDATVLCAVYGKQEMGNVYFELSPQNAGVSGLITVSEVYVADQKGGEKYIGITAIKGDKEFQSREYRVSDLGIATPNITCEAYRLCYRVPSSPGSCAQISDIKIQTVKPDGRFGRGYQAGAMPNGG